MNCEFCKHEAGEALAELNMILDFLNNLNLTGYFSKSELNETIALTESMREDLTRVFMAD
jgi:hypothetical protein